MNALHALQDTALRYFHAVVQTGSVSAAAARLHVAASAISRQINGLEARLGQPLFERHARGMVPTAAGDILAQLASRMHADAAQALEAIEALDGLRAGLVRVATSDVFANDLVPRVCALFRQQHPGVRFAVTQIGTAHVPQQVLSGHADIGLCFSMAPVKGICVNHRQRAPVLAVMAPGHPLSAARRPRLADLAAHRLALPPPETAIRQMIDLACSRQGLLLEPVLTSNHAQTLLDFVRHDGGATFASEVGVRHMLATGALLARPLADEGMDGRDIQVQTLAGRQLPVAVQAFLSLLIAQLAQLAHLPALA
ncbi:MAG: LysR substrate-binding domain-containing protein [Pseudomonadota bacterium]|nr:LysR substrate-binding domain-containing protein [Pseudomonadota bacterium]